MRRSIGRPRRDATAHAPTPAPPVRLVALPSFRGRGRADVGPLTEDPTGPTIRASKIDHGTALTTRPPLGSAMSNEREEERRPTPLRPTRREALGTFAACLASGPLAVAAPQAEFRL